MMKFDGRSADTFGQVDLVVNKPGIPKVALLSPRLKHSLVACGAAALLAFAVGLLVAVFGALAADEPSRPRPTAERAGADSARLQPTADEAYLRSKGVRAAYIIVDVTRDRLDWISAMVERGTLNLPVGEVLDLADASTAHRMLDGASQTRKDRAQGRRLTAAPRSSQRSPIAHGLKPRNSSASPVSESNSKRRNRMNQFTNKADVVTGGSGGIGLAEAREPMNLLIKALAQARPRTT
jgi:hypothetical protein